ncbi:MAG: hypothetical protein IJP93_06755 [Bacteroidales bacterium]|nr:hypothetical protein [Bacteroidales bacterium]
MMIKRFLHPAALLLAFLLLSCLPSQGRSRRVAVVIDRESYAAASGAVQAWADATTRYDGKKVSVIVVEPDCSPELIRDTLRRLWKEQRLEGAILAGEIPVPMIRRAHHLATAFKMNPSMPIKRSSIPSDRFYDDFGLRFSFLKQDGALWYYDLSPEGDQRVKCDIYTARVKPSKADPEHSFTELIAEFFTKAARTKASPEPLDEVFHFGGHGNSSESFNARIDEERAYYEQFALKEPEGRVRFLNFDEERFTRDRLLSTLARPEIDFAHIHSHGAVGAQYISKEPYTYMTGEHIENVKSALRSRMRRAKDKEKAAGEICASFDVPRSWLAGWDDASVERSDSIRAAAVDITLKDLDGYKSGAKLILLDACFNGAFLHDDYIASRYAFSHGSRTLAVTANSVNIIQDHWKNELAGMLAAGTCVGEWCLQYMTLESHLFGDPTFHFSAAKGGNPDTRRGKAIHDGAKSIEQCQKILCSDPSMNVRLEAFYYIMREAGQTSQLQDAIAAGLEDSYEMLRRMAARYAEVCGAPGLLPAIARHYLDPQETARVRYHLFNAFSQYRAADVEREMRACWDGIWPVKDDFEAAVKRICTSLDNGIKDIEALLQPDADVKDKTFTVSHQRNACIPAAIVPMLSIIADSSAPEDLRIKAAEALGWYTHSFRRDEVYRGLGAIGGVPDAVADEIRRSLRRLEDNAHTK